MKIPVAIYARVSSERQAEGESIDHQISLLKEYMARNLGEQYYTDESLTYVDEGISGFSTVLMDRHAIQNLFRDAELGKFKVVLFKEISRLGRDEEENIKIPRILESFNVRVIATNDLYDSSQPDTKIFFSLQSVLAEKESDKISTRVSSGFREKARAGKWNGIPPMGYKLNPITKTLEIDDNKKEIPLKVFDWYVNNLLGGKAIAERLNELGYKSSRGGLFTRQFVADMIRNPAYIGKVVYGKTRTKIKREYDQNKNLTKKRKVQIETGDPIIIDNAHPVLIDEKTYWKAQEILAGRGEGFGFANNAKHPLVGIAVCEHCKKGMICQFRNIKTTTGTRSYRYYKCSTYHGFGMNYCRPINAKAETLEKAIYDDVMKSLNQVINNRKGAYEKEQQTDSLTDKISKFEIEKKKLIKQQMQLGQDRDLYADETFRELMIELKRKINALDEMIEITKNQIHETQKQADNTNYLAESMVKYENLDLTDIQKMREFFHLFVENVMVIDKQNIGEIQYKFNLN